MNKSRLTKFEKMHQQLLRMMMSNLDFRHYLSAATFLIEDCDWDKSYNIAELRRFECYESAMVVAYGRPFSQSRGHFPAFHWSMLGPNFSIGSGEGELDKKFIDCRNKLYAHSDADFTPISPKIWTTMLPNGETFDFVAAEGGENLIFEKLEVKAIHKFLWKIRHHLEEAIQNHPAARDNTPVRLRLDLRDAN